MQSRLRRLTVSYAVNFFLIDAPLNASTLQVSVMMRVLFVQSLSHPWGGYLLGLACDL